MGQHAVALEEHKRVLKQLAPLSGERRAMQNVAGVLVPRTVADAMRELEHRVKMLTAQLADLTEQHKLKAEQLRAFMAEHNLRFTSDQPQLQSIEAPQNA